MTTSTLFDENLERFLEDRRERRHRGDANVDWALNKRILNQVVSNGLRIALNEALAMGRDREPTVHNIVVHKDWMFQNRREKGVTPCLLALPRMGYIALQAYGQNDPNALASLGTLVVTDPRKESKKFITGFLDEQTWARLLLTMEGFHPQDRFVIHGGKWDACQADFASQLLGVLIGHPLPGEIGTTSVMSYVLTEGAKGDPTAWAPTLIEYGTSLDYWDQANSWIRDMLYQRWQARNIQQEEEYEVWKEELLQNFVFRNECVETSKMGLRMRGPETKLFTQYSY